METKTVVKNRFKVALCASTVIDLFTLIHPKNDIDGQVMKALQEGTLRAEDWADVEYDKLPKLLQDRSLGHISDGKYYRLENVYTLYQQIIQGKIIPHITPSTFFRLTGLNDMEMDFLDQYIVNITIDKKDASEIYGIIYDLVLKHKEAERKVKAEYRVFEMHQFKAFAVAEAAVCGLPLITNDMSLVHIKKGDYKMTKIIHSVNRDFKPLDLGVSSKVGQIITPTTMSLSSFLKSLEDERYYLYPSNRKLRINTLDDTIFINK